MARTDSKVGYSPGGEHGDDPARAAAQSVQNVIRVLEGRWKLVILFQLFGGNVRRFSELERAIPGISQKMLIQQLRQLEADGVVDRTTYAVVPPRVEYRLTEWGQSLCPVLDDLLTWAESAPDDVRGRLIDPDATATGAPPPSPTASATPSEPGGPTSDTGPHGRPPR